MTQPVGFEDKVAFVWKVADRLRGHFKPHEYGAVMLPLLVLRRLDAVLEPSKAAVLAKAAALEAAGITNPEPILKRAAGQRFYNVSPMTLTTLLQDSKNVAVNLRAHVNAFSPGAVEVLEEYRFDDKITRLDKAGILYAVLGDFVDLDLHPDRVSNEAMGYVFEELLRKFSEMSNETAGEHYTPREVIRLMVALLFAQDTEALTGPAPLRTVYDPAAGTGGMLTVATAHLQELNPAIRVEVYGQELNPETWAIARSDLMIKGADPERMTLGNTLTADGWAGRHWDYMLSNPPYGVAWATYADPIRREADQEGWDGRFGAGLPRVSDGSLLFLQHMIAKMKPVADDPGTPWIDGGSRIGIVLSGSPLFSGAAGSGESEIRRWIIENDWLEGIVALPDQMFYNTGISTYVWIVTNRKHPDRAGTVTLVDAREMGTKMRKSLGDKRKELTGEAINEITRLYAEAVQEPVLESRNSPNAPRAETRGVAQSPLVSARGAGGGDRSSQPVEGGAPGGVEGRSPSGVEGRSPSGVEGRSPSGVEGRVKVMANQEFGFARITVERPMRRVWVVPNTGVSSDDVERYPTEAAARAALKARGMDARTITATLKAAATPDPDAPPIPAKKGGGYEPDPDLRDAENIPLPYGYIRMTPAERLAAVAIVADRHLKDEIHPYVPDAWIDHTKTKIGYEIPFTRQFYVYTPPRPVAEIRAEIDALEVQIQEWMGGLAR